MARSSQDHCHSLAADMSGSGLDLGCCEGLTVIDIVSHIVAGAMLANRIKVMDLMSVTL